PRRSSTSFWPPKRYRERSPHYDSERGSEASLVLRINFIHMIKHLADTVKPACLLFAMLAPVTVNLVASEESGIEHGVVYQEPGRFGGWPANHGIWVWEDEILVGFGAPHYKDQGPNRHATDPAKPEED